MSVFFSAFFNLINTLSLKMLKSIVFLLSYTILAGALETNELQDQVELTQNSSIQNLNKRGYHEELPLIYMAEDDHPSEHFWTKPYYPTR